MYNTDHFYPAKEDFFKKIYVFKKKKSVMLRSGHQFCRSKNCGVYNNDNDEFLVFSKMGFPHSLQRLESPKLRRCACL